MEGDQCVSGLYLYQVRHSMWLLCVRSLWAPRLRCHSNHWTFLKSEQQKKAVILELPHALMLK